MKMGIKLLVSNYARMSDKAGDDLNFLKQKFPKLLMKFHHLNFARLRKLLKKSLGKIAR